MKPQHDLCDTCQENILSLRRAANTSDTEKTEKLRVYTEHMGIANGQRNYFKETVRPLYFTK